MTTVCPVLLLVFPPPCHCCRLGMNTVIVGRRAANICHEIHVRLFFRLCFIEIKYCTWTEVIDSHCSVFSFKKYLNTHLSEKKDVWPTEN